MSPHRSFTLLLVIAFLTTSCGEDVNKNGGAPKAEARQGPTSGSSNQATQPADLPRARTEDLGALIELIAADVSELPVESFDMAYLAKSLGSDPQRHYEWVRDHTSWAPYRGLLRGPKGVLLDRVGSSLDRAVLLGELLRLAGHQVRLAHADLPQSSAEALLAAVKASGIHGRKVDLRPTPADRRSAYERAMPGIESAIERQTAVAAQRFTEALAIVDTQSKLLSAAVSGAVGPQNNEVQGAIAALRDHWWVERNNNGEWVPMDVMFPDAHEGDSQIHALMTSDWRTDAAWPSIPASDFHSVGIRVVIERYSGEVTSESTVLETTLRPAEVFDRPIMLGHMPRDWPATQPAARPQSAELRNAALWVTEWVPFLRVGKSVTVQHGFTDRGELAQGLSASVSGLGTRSGGGFGDFGSALTGAEDEESFATAEWLDYEIHVPGQTNEVVRRTVFDLLGPSRRAAPAAGFEADSDLLRLERFEALSGRTDILLQPCDFSPEFVVHLLSRDVVAAVADFRRISREGDREKLKQLVSEIRQRIDLWGPLPELALWRGALGRMTSGAYIDRPNILNYRVNMDLGPANGVAYRHFIDIAANSTGVRHGTAGNSFEVRLQQGVADTVAEIMTLGSDLRAADNTAAIFGIAATRKDNGVVIRPGDSTVTGLLDWPADPAARLAQDVKGGFVVLALARAVPLNGSQRLGWWRVNPRSGETIGVMDSGFHVISEEALLEGAQTSNGGYNLWIVLQNAAAAQVGPPPSMLPVVFALIAVKAVIFALAFFFS